jgi:hypothetical protein
MGSVEDTEFGAAVLAACTLPTAEQPVRVAEFRELLGGSVRTVRRISPTRLRLDLDGAAEAAVRDLAARETECCAFFSFAVSRTGSGTVRMDVEVPPGRTDVLDGLAALAAGAA